MRFQFSWFVAQVVGGALFGVALQASDQNPVDAAPARSVRRAEAASVKPPPTVQLSPVLPPLPDGASDLPFNHLIVTPVGATGLELSEAARKLLGQPVRLIGHMVRQMQPIPYTFLLSPVPQSLHERDYFLCDDLPANTVRVYVPKGPQPIVPYRPGLVAVTGTLTNEGPEESDGRSSIARLILRPNDTNAMVYISAYTRVERTNAPAAPQFSARNGRELETNNRQKP